MAIPTLDMSGAYTNTARLAKANAYRDALRDYYMTLSPTQYGLEKYQSGTRKHLVKRMSNPDAYGGRFISSALDLISPLYEERPDYSYRQVEIKPWEKDVAGIGTGEDILRKYQASYRASKPVGIQQARRSALSDFITGRVY